MKTKIARTVGIKEAKRVGCNKRSTNFPFCSQNHSQEVVVKCRLTNLLRVETKPKESRRSMSCDRSVIVSVVRDWSKGIARNTAMVIEMATR